MKTSPDVRRSLLSALVALLASCAAMPAVAEQSSREQVQKAADQVRADPNLGHVKHEKTLRFKEFQLDDNSDKTKPDDKPRERSKAEPPGWAVGFAHWLSETGHVFVWVVGAIAVAFVAATAHRWMRARGESQQDRKLAALPSHVRDLDIRPQSLPDSIGEAARKLWLRGEQREALSLLYRGTLSRLVHGHAVPIRAASTEGECVRLAQGHVNAECGRYVGDLVQAWQLAVYGARMPESATVMALCDAFDLRLKPAATPALAANEVRP